ncbi:MAG: hypothetical protein WA395_01055, partial [Nitrososphaeraceae archaeon]
STKKGTCKHCFKRRERGIQSHAVLFPLTSMISRVYRFQRLFLRLFTDLSLHRWDILFLCSCVGGYVHMEQLAADFSLRIIYESISRQGRKPHPLW